TCRAGAEASNPRKTPFAAHPLDTPEELLRAGLRSVDHFLAFPPLDSRSDAERRSLFKQMAASGMFMSTAMVNIDRSIFVPYAEGKRRLDDTAGKLDANRKYVCGYLVEDWREQVEENKDSPYESFRKQL